MRVQRGSLLTQSLDDPWVTVTYVRNIVVGIQVALTVSIVKPDAFAPHEL
jgi:hypothetical protein